MDGRGNAGRDLIRVKGARLSEPYCYEILTHNLEPKMLEHSNIC